MVVAVPTMGVLVELNNGNRWFPKNNFWEVILLEDLAHKIEELTEKIKDLKSRFPAHSVKPWMVEELETLEEELERLQEIFNQAKGLVH